MRATLAQLEALVAVVDAGTFEAGARALHVSVSAVSQRISGLERLTGYPVVTRSRPAQVTQPGELLLRLARQTSRLLSDYQDATDTSMRRDPISVSLAVNADSLSTWFSPMLRWFARSDVLLRLCIEDQDRTAHLLERAVVVGAVSTRPDAPPGCRAVALGHMRYLPVCAPELLPADGLDNSGLASWLALTPTLRFDPDDALPDRFAEQLGVSRADLRAHLIPSNREYLDGVRAGLGWSVLPADQIIEDLRHGRLVRLPTHLDVDVSLYWHRWRIASTLIDRIDAEVRRCADALPRDTLKR